MRANLDDGRNLNTVRVTTQARRSTLSSWACVGLGVSGDTLQYRRRLLFATDAFLPACVPPGSFDDGSLRRRLAALRIASSRGLDLSRNPHTVKGDRAGWCNLVRGFPAGLR